MNPNIRDYNPDERNIHPQGPDGGGRQHQQYKFTPEELRVIKECNRESFFQRCIPFGTILGVTTYYGVQSGYLRPSPRFGAVPKVSVAVIVGYFLGKFSYQGKCAQKIMQLPNSPLADMLRKRRQGTYQESLEPGFGPGMSLAPFSGISPSDTYSDLGPVPQQRATDIDTSRPTFEGLDDSHRPTIDSSVYEEEMPPVQKHVTSYDELRKKNRDEYQQKRTLNYREPHRPPAPQRPTSESSEPPEGPRNIYGDSWST